MKRILKFSALALLVVITVILVAAAMQPNTFRVARSATVKAPPEVVFNRVNVLKNWEAWNPWGKIDPNMKLTYDGPESGVGASYSWAGNNDVGEGRGTITESRANELVQLKLEFFKPMAGVSVAEFTFASKGGETEVTWTMTGKNSYVAKIFCMFMNMDKMIGGQFDKGLADLKQTVESSLPQ